MAPAFETLSEQALRRAADMFHEIGCAITVEDMLADTARQASVTEKLREKLQEKLRSPDQLRMIASEGFELCGHTFLLASATDVEQERNLTTSTLHRGARMFHEIRGSLEVMKLRSQVRALTLDGFELCVRALAALGAPDVMIHECGVQAFGEQPWSSGDES